MHVMPAIPGLKVRDPERSSEAKRTVFLPSDGAEVPDNDYWRDRLAAGDVVASDGTAPAPKPRAPKAAKPVKA